VLGADVVVAQAQRLAQRELQDLLGARRERDLPARHLFAGADDPHDLRTDSLDGDVQALEDARSQPLLLAEKAEQDVLGADVVVLERPRLFLREDDHLSGSLSESLEHGAADPSCWAWPFSLGSCVVRLGRGTRKHPTCPHLSAREGQEMRVGVGLRA
jgi:hypothetical protein